MSQDRMKFALSFSWRVVFSDESEQPRCTVLRLGAEDAYTEPDRRTNTRVEGREALPVRD